MRNFLEAAVAGSATLLLASLPPPAAAAGPVKNIVLVHGAWADGSGWRGVYDILTKDGFTVSVVANPDTGSLTMWPRHSASWTGRLDR